MTELLAIIRENRMENKLNEVLVERLVYSEQKTKEGEAWNQLLKTNLNEEQFLALSRYLDEQNYFDSEYGEVAYELGVRDGVNLVKELKDLVEIEFQ